MSILTLAIKMQLTNYCLRYLLSPSVAEKWNITWAGQTMGPQFGSDGRLYGDVNVVSIDCANNVCNVPMKAPSAAIVFLTQEALANSSPASGETLTFSTSTLTGAQVATVDWAAVAVSNGRNGQLPLGGTSPKSVNGAPSLTPSSGLAFVTVICAMLLGLIMQ